MSKDRANNVNDGDAQLRPEHLPGVMKAFQLVTHDRKRLESEGLSETTFMLGVLNVIVTTFVVARFPESFWVWHTFKTCTLVFFQVVRRFFRREHLYTLDFCWLASLGAFVWGALELSGTMPPQLGEIAYYVMFTFANGPLGWSVSLLQNRLVFHSADYASSLFIHLSPVLTTWGLRWHGDAVRRVWGEKRFSFAYDSEPDFDWTTCMGYPLMIYAGWWLLYTTWLLIDGVNCPSRNCPTVFDFNRRKMGFGKLPFIKDLSIRGQAAVYMVTHAVAVIASLFWPILCWHHFWVHTIWAALSICSAVYHGASYYNFWLGKRFANAISKYIEAEFGSEYEHRITNTDTDVGVPVRQPSRSSSGAATADKKSQ